MGTEGTAQRRLDRVLRVCAPVVALFAAVALVSFSFGTAFGRPLWSVAADLCSGVFLMRSALMMRFPSPARRSLIGTLIGRGAARLMSGPPGTRRRIS